VVCVEGDVAVGSDKEKIGLSVRRLWIGGFLMRGLLGSGSFAAAGAVITTEIVGGRAARGGRRVWSDLRWCKWPSASRFAAISRYSCCILTKKISRSSETGWVSGESVEVGW
jgi:hypothetical protein